MNEPPHAPAPSPVLPSLPEVLSRIYSSKSLYLLLIHFKENSIDHQSGSFL